MGQLQADLANRRNAPASQMRARLKRGKGYVDPLRHRYACEEGLTIGGACYRQSGMRV